jgi:flagellar basal-body rod protein FlgC
MINFVTGIESTSAALQAERVRMAVASQNIANANTTRGLDGLPYQRQSVVFESVLAGQTNGLGIEPQKVQISRIEKDQNGPRMIYSPGHPDADPNTGMVAMPSRVTASMARFSASALTVGLRRLKSSFAISRQPMPLWILKK